MIINKWQQLTKAIRNAGKVLNMKLVAINKISGKLKVWSFKIPHYAQPNRYAQAKTEKRNDKFATRKCKNGKPTHKQHIWFLPTRKSRPEKPKELFFCQRY